MNSSEAEILSNAASYLSGPINDAKQGLAKGWKSFADAMDKIFLPEAIAGQAMAQSSHTATSSSYGVSQVAVLPRPPQDVPSLFRLPSIEEVQELLESEGLPAYVALPGRGFVPKKLCLDSGSNPSIYVLEHDSSVPSVFFGLTGFELRQLRRVVVGAASAHPGNKPLLSLEFHEGFLPVRLGDATVLRGLVGVLCSNRSDVEIAQNPDWQ